MEISEILCFVITLIAIICICVTIWHDIKLRRMVNNLNRMLDAAIDNKFYEHTFDESLLSATESKLFKFLSASEISSKNLNEEKNKIKEMISDISHQTKTPIANILLYSQLLAEQELTVDGKTCVCKLSSQAEKLRFLIDSLVKLSRLESGILTLASKEVPIQSILTDVEYQFSPKVLEKGVALHVQSTDAVALFDTKWTAEALGNLIDNAIKYTPSGGKIMISVSEYELFCRIDIRDTGIGIAENEQAKIFSRFYRSASVSTQEGVGIGLYLVREILTGQGGYIKLSSELGKGSTFSVFLPRLV